MAALLYGADLRRHLDRWVAEGLIDGAQAARIEAAEAAWAGQAPAISGEAPPASQAPRAVPRAPLVAEALGYAGGVLAIMAGFLVVRELWPGIPTEAQLAFAAVACAALGVAGAVLRAQATPLSGGCAACCG